LFSWATEGRWTSEGRPQEKVIEGRAGMPGSASYAFPAAAQPDDRSEIVVEALTGSDGKLKGQVWGLFSNGN